MHPDSAIGQSGRLQMTVGRIHTARYEYPEAVAAYNEALRLSPLMIPAKVELGRVYLLLGNVDLAVQNAEAAAKAAPNYGEAQLLLAQALLAKNDAAGAEAPMKVLATAAPRPRPLPPWSVRGGRVLENNLEAQAGRARTADAVRGGRP